MNNILLVILSLNIIAIVLLLFILSRKNKGDGIGDRIEHVIKDEMLRNREELGNSIRGFSDSVTTKMTEIASLQKNQLDIFSSQLIKLSSVIDSQLKDIREDNNIKLEKMRETVDEKLTSTLEKRLSDSFKRVSDHLESVHVGLGEMKLLATDVGDLKRVLTNVKTRGTWGEIQLERILDEILTKSQYEKNVEIKKDSGERVEFAIKLPSKDKSGKEILLPIDAKFPQEDYHRLIEAEESGDFDAAEIALKQLEICIKKEARTINEKYIDPPNTTDFAILFLPIEGLYAQIIKNPVLSEKLQRDYKIVIAGPQILLALLNSLQMGFRSLAIEKRSSEVWNLLILIKNEFNKFGTILDKTQKKLKEASTTIESASKKTRTIERKLRNVEEIPVTNLEDL